MQIATLPKWLATANSEPRIGHSVLWSILGCGFLLFWFPAYSSLKFWWNGESVQGVVTTAPVEAPNPPKFGPKYIVRYKYSDTGGTVHQSEGLVRQPTDYRPSDPIEVRYLRV